MSEVLQQQPPPANLLNPPVPEPPEKKDNNVPQQKSGMYKSLLNQYAQKTSNQSPVYQTLNEGAQHQPQFRSYVWIDGCCYKSPNTFSQRKAAEMEVSRVAFLAITQKRKDEGVNLIREDTVFCKSILTEYAVRMNLEKPSYQTTQPDLSLPLFSSSLVFNGVTYTGEFARNKIEAQRLAARAVILSILDTESGNVMSEIINSKFKLYTAMNKAKNSLNLQVGITPGRVLTENGNDIQLSKANEVEVDPGTNNIPPPLAITEPYPGQNTSIPVTDLPLLVFQPPKPEMPTSITPLAISLAPSLEQTPLVGSTTVVVTPPIIVDPPTSEQISLGFSASGQKRKRRNKRKAKKKAQVEAPLPLDVKPLSQIDPCSVAQ